MERKTNKRPEPSDSETSSTGDTQQRAVYVQKVRESSEAIQRGDFPRAVHLYTEALTLTPQNYILYSNRSACYIKLNKPDKALRDARKTRELNPKWPKGYYREGVALQCLGRVADALASYSVGLVQDPKNNQLLHTLQQACLQSPLKERFGPLFSHLQKMKLDQSAFVTVSVIGQELLAGGFYSPSVTVLESALRIGTCSIKLRGSVFSALSTAHWGLGNIDKAIACMQQDLAIAKSLGDQPGECRAHGNLGAAYFSKGNHREALQHHRLQLVLAMRLKDTRTAATSLSSLGHVYTAIGDYTNALTSHKQCAFLVKQTKDKLQEAREIGNMGSVFLAMGDQNKALECHNEHLKIAKNLDNKVEEARAYSNMGSVHHYTRDYEAAVSYHKQVLSIAMELSDRTLEARAYAGLGHAARCMHDLIKAKYYHEKQLDNALQTKDNVARGRACSNLGIIFHQLGEHDASLKLHKDHLQIAKDLGDRASQGRAYGNMGNAHSSLKQYDLAVRFHKQELAISKEVCDRHSEAATHGNLAVAYQCLQMYDKAMYHYTTHLDLARQLKDTQSEARALSNLGNYYSSRKDYQQAIPMYEQYLLLSQELQDLEGEGRACHKLGYVHYSLGNFREAIRYYEQELALAKDQQDKTSMCRAYCNLGLAHKSLQDYSKALECQKYFLTTASMTKNSQAKFLALGNIGDVLSRMDNTDEAVNMFNQQLALARQMKNRKLEAMAFSNLGTVHKKLKQFDKALGYHNQEMFAYQEINDTRGECRAHGNLGNIHMSLRNYSNACRCYEEQLDCSRDLKDINLEARAYGNLGITKMNMNHTNDAIGYFESQLAMLEQVTGHQGMLERGHANSNLANCYESLGDHEEAVKYYEQYLAIAQSSTSISDQESAYRYLGNAHRAMGNLQQSLVCFEKRLVVAHELDKPEAKGSAYGELGCLHSLLGNYEQAISCLQHQLQAAKDLCDQQGEGEAACGLGGIYQQMGEYDKALEYHQIDLNIAETLNSATCQCRAFGNLGLSQESLGNFEEALKLQEKHLKIATETNDKTAKTLAYSSLGRILHAQGDYQRAVEYLEQGLMVADQVQRPEDEAKIRHRLGLALWGQGDLEGAQVQLYGAIDLFESMRREAQYNCEYKLSLFDLQTASYQALQRVLVALGRTDDALVVAERGRTRAFVDLLLERQSLGSDMWYSSLDSSPVTKECILETVTRQRAAVLYFSMAAGYLYCWLILPDKGIVKFHESAVSESDISSDPEDTQSLRSFRSISVSTTSLLDSYVGQAREFLGVESHLSSSRLSMSGHMSETESEADDLWQQHLEEIGEKINNDNDHTGFLRMERRDHIWNASSYSLGSMLSFSTLGNRTSSIRSKISNISTSSVSNRPALPALYDLLLKPVEDDLPPTAGHQGCRELIMVLQGDLYLVPFALLRPSQTATALCERYNLLAVPSIRALQASQALSKHVKYNPDCTGAVVIGNPKLQQNVVNMWQWTSIPATEHECRMVSEMMGCRSLTGSNATKENVLKEIPNAELIHFATHVSWKLAALVMSHGSFSTTSSVHGNLERMDLSDTSSDIVSMDGPSLSDIIITAADILNTRLNAKLVVLSSGYSDDRAGRINTDGVVGLTRAFLAAGAQCILFSLWPVPDMASRMLMKSFYTAMLQGAKASQALSSAMKTLQNSRQYSHPSYWASWLLIGSDVKLSSKVALMGHSLCELLKTPDQSREAMRVVLHLVEKSLQRIHHGQRKAMYTTQASIDNKVGEVKGWRDLLTSVGFRLEPGTNDMPGAVFFPTFDPGDRLAQCSASLQALLGLPLQTLSALAKMVEHGDVGEMVMSLIRDASTKFGQDGGFQVPVNVRLWRAPGVHEFLASLGFDLVEVGKDEVTLRVGKQANRRMLQFGLQSLVAVFDTQEAPRTLLLDSSSSMESLCSSGSATSTSNFSKGSTPSTSPRPKHRSFFNPSEVDKLPSASVNKSPSCAVSPRTLGATDVTIHLHHQNIIREKYSSPSGSDLSDVNMGESSHARVLSVDTGEGSCPEDLIDGPITRLERLQRSTSASRSRNKYDRKSVMYSTSASDSEDGLVPENNLSRAKSRSSQSLASQASTITVRSTGSGTSGFRRNRSRASIASTRSSASDRTLTCDSRNGSQETLVDVDSRESISQSGLTYDHSVDNLSDSGIHSKHTDTATDNSADNDGRDSRSRSRTAGRRRERSLPREEYRLSDDFSDTPLRSSNMGKHDMSAKKHDLSAKKHDLSAKKHDLLANKTIKDPTSVAHKVLAETGQQREALEAMQRWSVQSMAQKWEEKGDSSPAAPNVTSRTNAEPNDRNNSMNDKNKPIVIKDESKPVLPVKLPATPPSPPKTTDTTKPIPREPDRPAPTLQAKPPTETKPIQEFKPKLPSFSQPTAPAKPKPILANSVMDNTDSYTCNPGERVSFLHGPLDMDLSFSQSELESDNELSVIEEESEGMSDVSNSYTHDELAARIRGLQLVKPPSLIRNDSITDTSSLDIPWYEDHSPSATEKISSHPPVSRSPSPPTPRSTKTVTFQDEVQMEILSQCDEILDDPDPMIHVTDLNTPGLQIHETDLDEGLDLDRCEGEEMSVDGDLTPTAELPTPIQSEHNQQDNVQRRDSIHDMGAEAERGPAVRSAIQYRPPQIPPPPVGYKPPPPYPGQRRQGSNDSTNSGENLQVTNGQYTHRTDNTVPPPHVPQYNAPHPHSQQRLKSVSPNDSFDLNTPQNLARMSKQFYQGSTNGTAQLNGSFRQAQVPEKSQASQQHCKPVSSNANSWSKERSYDGTGALRTINYQGQNGKSANHVQKQYQPPHPTHPNHLQQRVPFPRQHQHPSQGHTQGQSHPAVQGQHHPNPRQYNGYPGQGHNYSGQPNGYLGQGHQSRGRTSSFQSQGHRAMSGESEVGHSGHKDWYHSDNDSVSSYQEIDPRHMNAHFPNHRPQNGPHGSPSRIANQNNGFSSPNSISSHDSSAEMRSIFPGARSPQNNIIPNIEDGVVRYGDTMLHASKC